MAKSNNSGVPDGSNYTVYELKSLLDTAEIEYANKARKSDLVKIYNNTVESGNSKLLEAILASPTSSRKRKRSKKADDDENLSDNRPKQKKKLNKSKDAMEDEEPAEKVSTPPPAQVKIAEPEPRVEPAVSKQERRSPTPPAAASIISAPSTKSTSGFSLRAKTDKKTKASAASTSSANRWEPEPHKETNLLKMFIILGVFIAVLFTVVQVATGDNGPVKALKGVPFCGEENQEHCMSVPDHGIVKNGFLIGCEDGYSLISSKRLCVGPSSPSVVSAARLLGKLLMNNQHCPNPQETALTVEKFVEASNNAVSLEDIEALKTLEGHPFKFDEESNSFVWVNSKFTCSLFDWTLLNKRKLIVTAVVLLLAAYYYHYVSRQDESRIDELRGMLLWHIKSLNGKSIKHNELQDNIRSDYPGRFENYYWLRAYEQLERDPRIQAGIDTWKWLE